MFISHIKSCSARLLRTTKASLLVATSQPSMLLLVFLPLLVLRGFEATVSFELSFTQSTLSRDCCPVSVKFSGSQSECAIWCKFSYSCRGFIFDNSTCLELSPAECSQRSCEASEMVPRGTAFFEKVGTPTDGGKNIDVEDSTIHRQCLLRRLLLFIYYEVE